ncbi:MAG TPA: hypothetical protein VLZ74_06065 [Methylocella sp.]|nr:hypothetical protein [Methylocella sp.]
MRSEFWLSLVLVAELFGSSASPEEVSAADNFARSADPLKGNPSLAESKDAAAGEWHLVRSAGPNGEPGSSAILHTADFERSNPRLAGLMLRCGKEGVETIIVVVEPFPPQARPQITLRAAGAETRFAATVIPTGAGLRLPSEATGLITGISHTARGLDIKVDDGNTVFEGVVGLSGLPEAFHSLNADCVQK